MITIVISAISPAFAYSATDGFNPVSFWEYVYRGFGGGNRDGGFGGGGFGGSDPDSWTTSDDMKNDYNDFVSTLPATGYDSAGKLLWQPSFMDATNLDGGTVQYIGFIAHVSLYTGIISGSVSGLVSPNIQNLDGASVSISGSKIHFDFTSTLKSYDVVVKGNRSGPARLCFPAPIAGSYSVVASPFITAQLETGKLTNYYTTTEYSWRPALVNSGNPYGAGGVLYADLYWSDANGNKIFPSDGIGLTGARKHITFSTPIFQITPASSNTTTINNTYNINTRVNNFQGNYYNNVTNNYYNNTTIINETTNNYYDMTTNNYYTMSNWSYDYQSRTYFVTLEDGTTITVQFGDDCLTITNNNVENSYQYVINNNNTPSPNPETPSTCKHNWTETIDVAPTCLEGGHANFTCSLCGETYEQILSAKGHNWTVKEHVNTVYGENGVIVTQGHTLYECSACGEQWYTETATPPPDVSGGSNILAWLQEFKTWLGDKLDNLFQGDGDTNNFWSTNKKSFTDVLSSLLQTLLDFLTDILEKLLGLVKDLLSFLFDLISSVVITGISDFFTGLKDSRLFDFVVKDDEGSVTALPEGVATVFAFFSGVILALPVELRSILLFGTAIIVLIGVIKIIKS